MCTGVTAASLMFELSGEFDGDDPEYLLSGKDFRKNDVV